MPVEKNDLSGAHGEPCGEAVPKNGASSVFHAPDGKWEFDEKVTECFDDMLRRSIPQYDVMRQAVFDLACRHARAHTSIVDLGCSRGDAMAQLVDRFGAQNRFVGVEVSKPMLEAARCRFAGMIDCGVVDIRCLDLRTTFPQELASVVLSVFTLQFVPIDYRLGILKKVHDSLTTGGAFIWCEKIMGSSADLQAEFVEVYHEMKARNGYGRDEIERKRLALEGVLVPVPARWNEEMLRSAGFTNVDCFWRWMNFAGWIAVR